MERGAGRATTREREVRGDMGGFVGDKLVMLWGISSRYARLLGYSVRRGGYNCFWRDPQNRGLASSYFYSLWRGIFFSVCFFRFWGRWGWVGIKCFTHGKWNETSKEGYAFQERNEGEVVK